MNTVLNEIFQENGLGNELEQEYWVAQWVDGQLVKGQKIDLKKAIEIEMKSKNAVMCNTSEDRDILNKAVSRALGENPTSGRKQANGSKKDQRSSRNHQSAARPNRNRNHEISVLQEIFMEAENGLNGELEYENYYEGLFIDGQLRRGNRLTKAQARQRILDNQIVLSDQGKQLKSVESPEEVGNRNKGRKKRF